MERAEDLDLSWYEIVEAGSPLEQGDILRACPVPVLVSELPTTAEAAATAALEYEFDILDLIILSQSCDIAEQNGRPRRIENVLVCPAWELGSLRAVNPGIDRSGFIGKIVKGEVPLWHALAPCDLSGMEREHTFLEFGRLIVLPALHLASLAQIQTQRLRLRSPWREHMSHAAGELLSRPAIPSPAPMPPRR